MSDFADLTREVLAALDELEESVHARDMHSNGGLSGDPAVSQAAWKSFLKALRATADVVRNPQPRQGLAAIWLRVVFQRAEMVQRSAKHHGNGWEDIILHNDDNLFWLVTNGWLSGYRLLKATSTHENVGSLIEPERSAFSELEELADSWGPRKPGLPALESRFVERAGQLLLKAVDDLEVDKKWLSDEEFCARVLRDADTPSALISPQLKEISGAGLRDVLRKFLPEQAAPKTTPANDRYLKSKNHMRDEWIYQSVQLYDYQTLSEMLKELAAEKKWKFLKSRNGFKGAVRRYAKCHDLDVQFFPDDRNFGGR